MAETPKGYRGPVCLRLMANRVRNVGEGFTAIDEAQLLSVAVGCESDHLAESPRPIETGDVVHIHVADGVAFSPEKS